MYTFYACIKRQYPFLFVIDYEDSNIINQKIDSYESKYQMDGKEKIDELKEISPSESKFITDTLQKERTGMILTFVYKLLY